jgi:hypothetical protein
MILVHDLGNRKSCVAASPVQLLPSGTSYAPRRDTCSPPNTTTGHLGHWLPTSAPLVHFTIKPRPRNIPMRPLPLPLPRRILNSTAVLTVLVRRMPRSPAHVFACPQHKSTPNLSLSFFCMEMCVRCNVCNVCNVCAVFPLSQVR